jgi:hypothetical protein
LKKVVDLEAIRAIEGGEKISGTKEDRKPLRVSGPLQKERVYVYFSWILIWCGTLKYQD